VARLVGALGSGGASVVVKIERHGRADGWADRRASDNSMAGAGIPQWSTKTVVSAGVWTAR
jgi:hypothetical protein